MAAVDGDQTRDPAGDGARHPARRPQARPHLRPGRRPAVDTGQPGNLRPAGLAARLASRTLHPLARRGAGRQPAANPGLTGNPAHHPLPATGRPGGREGMLPQPHRLAPGGGGPGDAGGHPLAPGPWRPRWRAGARGGGQQDVPGGAGGGGEVEHRAGLGHPLAVADLAAGQPPVLFRDGLAGPPGPFGAHLIRQHHDALAIALQGQHVARRGARRRPVLRAVVEIQLKAFYLTTGRYDIVTISETPDDAATAKVALTVGSAGNVTTVSYAVGRCAWGGASGPA